ncbi:SRPBCC domain-containing protein [Ottowia sp.]|uniref:SRPBCC family protein n=1 Tax=Ottowia sp. TaxID=1898956 RepID=UPI002CEC8012|nr:SRPBCC domain-containing protein [Ottowia sp.]HNR84140.1 SRPBCC domain-containing protein [Ottowia sp.]HNT85686.1 SRPBCC domain-containing protein [Ottowia sp.]
MRRHYAAAPQAVWRAWTDPQALMAWFGPAGPGTATVAEMDLQVGGRYRFAFSTPDGEAHEVSGVYQEVQPPFRLVFSWAWHSTPERVSRVTLDLQPADGGCELRFTHDRFFDERARANHQRGWPSFLQRLDGWLSATPSGSPSSVTTPRTCE